jgi:preprotein translocase subunit SecD
MAKKDASKDAKTGFDRWDELESENDGRSKESKRKKDSDSKKGKGRKGKKKMTAEARRYVSTLVVLLVVCAVSVVLFWPPGEKITQGLDIQGGVSVVLTATTSDGSDPSSEDMATAVEIVQSRVNSLGASEATVQQQGSNSILVQIPGATDAEQAVETIGQTGYLEFVRLDEIGDADAIAQLQAGKTDVELKEGTYTAFMDGSDIDSVSISQTSTGDYVVNLDLNDEGTEKFAEVTKDLVSTNGQIAIVLDGKIQSAPAVQSEITDGNVSISGGSEGFTLSEAQELKTVLDSGSLPVTLTYSESRVVGPTLGQDSLSQGVTAIAIGIVLVVAYLFFFYRGLGFLTLGSLAVFAILYLGIMAFLSSQGAFSLTLAGLAGMVLTIGMAADSSILVLERFREEIRMGRTVRNASISGVKHGIRTSLDADAVTLVTALALFFFAVGQVRGFGLTMTIGIVCDVATMFLFKSPALRLLARGTIQRHPKFWGISEDLEEAKAKADAKAEAKAAAANGKARKGGVANA